MTPNRTHGFTLLEVTIALGVLTILSLGMYAAVHVSAESSRLAAAKSISQAGVRDTLPAMIREIELAATPATAAGIPNAAGIQVFLDGNQVAPGQTGDLVVFQIPLDNDGANWSTPIQYRFVNEDTNGNGFLDPGEDVVDAADPTHDGNGDGILTRWIVREQDVNGDGTFNAPGERRVVGGVNELQAVGFALNPAGDLLTLSLTARQVMGGAGRVVAVQGQPDYTQQIEAHAVVSQASTQVYLFN